MGKHIFAFTIGLVLSIFTSRICFGQMLADPVIRSGTDKLTVDGGFAKSKVDYDLRSTRNIARTWIFSDLGYGITPSTDIFGMFGISLKSKYDDTAMTGKGFMLGGGGRAHFYAKGNLNVSVHGQVSYIDETFKGNLYYIPTGQDVGDATIDFDVFEMLFGGTASFQVQPKFSIYGGLELVPYSDGTAKAKATVNLYEGKASADVERSNIFNLRIGASFLLDEVKIHPFVIFVGETTFGIAASIKL